MLAARKSTHPNFHAILFDTPEQFKDYLSLAREHIDQLEGKQIHFVIAGKHWISGTIQLSTNAHEIKVAILDSIGIVKSPGFHPGDEDFDDGSTGITIAEYIAKIFPTAKLYFTDLTRQHSEALCPIFAINSVFKFPDNSSGANFEASIRILSQKESSIKLGYNNSLKYIPIVPALNSLTLVQSKSYFQATHLNKLGYSESELQKKTKSGTTKLKKITSHFKDLNHKKINLGAKFTFEKYKQKTVEFAETSENPQEVLNQMQHFSGQHAINELQKEPINPPLQEKLTTSEKYFFNNQQLEVIINILNSVIPLSSIYNHDFLSDRKEENFSKNYTSMEDKQMLAQAINADELLYNNFIQTIFNPCIRSFETTDLDGGWNYTVLLDEEILSRQLNKYMILLSILATENPNLFTSKLNQVFNNNLLPIKYGRITLNNQTEIQQVIMKKINVNVHNSTSPSILGRLKR